jgi:hypothetical protein
MKRAIIALAAIALSWPAMAQQGITLGEPAYGGTGCPDGTVAAVLSPNQTSLSILYDQYFVEAGQAAGRSFDRKSCNIAIPVSVPQGLSVSIIAVDYRGFNALPTGARSTFQVEYFFAGTRGPTFIRNFSGPLTSDYLIRNELTAAALVWSACGADVILRTNSSLRVTAPSTQDALATVDTEDVNAALVYLLQWRECR